MPETVILTYQPEFWAWIEDERAGEDMEVDPPFTCYRVAGAEDVAVAGDFGIGAPETAAVLEHCRVRGTERFVILGGCAAIYPSVEGGDVIVVDEAIRDEGTSHHYLEPSDTVSASPTLVDRLASAIDEAGYEARVGRTWTTDAIYRETMVEVEAYASDGALSVEMEAAAVLAIGQYYDLAAGAVLAPFDSLVEGEWTADVGGPADRLERLLPVVVDAV